MVQRLLKRLGCLALGSLALACATTNGAGRSPDQPQPGVNAEPIPAPSRNKAIIVPSDVNLGPGPAGPVNTGTAGAAISPATGPSGAPN